MSERPQGAVPFVDLRRAHAPLRTRLDAALAGVLDRGDFILGGEVGAFETEFARWCGARHAIGVGSGLDALVLSLEALGVGAGAEVITVANTFVATACAISRLGATPVLVDCVETTACIDTRQIEAAITPRTRAILPVHLYGRLAEMDAVLEIARRHGLPVVEDAAQAHGATRAGNRAGTFGAAGCFSFYPAKNLGALGDGGAVVTGDDDLAARLRLLRSYGERLKNRHEIVGVNSRLDTLQAAVLRVKLPHLDDWNAARRRAVARYRVRLAGTAAILFAEEDEAHVHHLMVVRVAEREAVRAALDRAGVGTGIHYPTPVHLQPAYAALGQGPGSFPVAERLAREVLSLPLFVGITDDEIDRTCDALLAALGA